jgi:hypothetical protein
MTEAIGLNMRRRRNIDTRRWPGFVFAIVIVLVESHALGQTLDEARQRYLEADFRGASEAFSAVLEVEEVGVQEAATAHIYLAALSLMFDDEPRARSHAEAALAIDPFLEPPAGSPSRLSELLRDINDDTGGQPAEIEIQHEELSGRDAPVVVSARLNPAPSLLAHVLSLECTTVGGDTVVERSSPPEVSLSISAVTGTLRCVAAALTAAGATLVLASSETEIEALDPVSFTPNHTEPEPEPEPESPRRRLWLWVGLATGIVVAATVVAVVLGVTLTSGDVILNETTIEGW